MTIRRLADPADASLLAVERIYLDALPAGERKPVAWLRSLARPVGPDRSSAGGASLLLVAESGTDVLGMAVLFVPAGPADAALLEYLAVTDAARGRGVGGRLFDHAAGMAGRPVLVEVESGDPDADRRRAFYRRHGCREVAGLRYALPLPGAPPMGLMVAGVDRLWRSDLSRWLATVYADVYGQRHDDTRLVAMTSAVGERVGLR